MAKWRGWRGGGRGPVPPPRLHKVAQHFLRLRLRSRPTHTLLVLFLCSISFNIYLSHRQAHWFSLNGSMATDSAGDGAAEAAEAAETLRGDGSTTLPPPLPAANAARYASHMKLWRAYAKWVGAPLANSDYQQVLDDLSLFERRFGGISASLVRHATQRFVRLPQLLTFNASGVYVASNFTGPIMKARTEWYLKKLKELHPSLPPDINLTLALNVFDEPLSWNCSLPPGVDEALAKGSITLKEAWHTYACDGAGLAKFKHMHGNFLSPPALVLARATLPVLSAYTIPGCYSGERGACLLRLLCGVCLGSCACVIKLLACRGAPV